MIVKRPGRGEIPLKLRFSIQKLMVLVLYIAVGLAVATAGAFSFAVVALAACTLGALRSRGPRRAFFLGCSVFGWTSMLLAFGFGPEARYALPSTPYIIRIYESINGSGPTTSATPEEVGRWIVQMSLAVNRAVTIGYSLIALAVALAGGTVLWLIVALRKRLAGRSRRPSPAASPTA
jgi:hypothetical protein